MRVLLTGSTGQLGAYVLDELVASGVDVIAWGHSQAVERSGVKIVAIDLEAADITAELYEAAPDSVIHLAAISTAEGVRLAPELAHRVNVVATEQIAGWCGRASCPLVFTSTDLVFDGTKRWWTEHDEPCPVLAYGKSKALAEASVRAIATGLVARVSLLYGYGRGGRETYFDRTLAGLNRGEPQTMFHDEFRTPLDLGTAAKALVKLAERRVSGTIHLGGLERMSRFELIRRAAIAAGLDASLVRGNSQRDVTFAEPRPADVSLKTTRWNDALPDLIRPSIETMMQRFHARTETN